MASIDFVYSNMWKYYCNNVGEPTDEIFVRIYDVDGDARRYIKENAKKYVKENKTDEFGHIQLFLNRGCVAKKLPPDDPLSGPHGTYIVCDKPPLNKNKQEKKNLFIVTPYLHTNERESVLTGDHYSFLVNYGVQADKRLQFHQTTYAPRRQDFSFGGYFHDKCHLPLRFQIPNDPDEFKGMLTQPVQHNAPFIKSMLSRPWTERQEGGGKSKKSRKMPSENGTFNDIWKHLPIVKLVVIGLRVRSGFDVTIFIKDSLRHDSISLSRAFAFHMKSSQDLHDVIAEKFAGWKWDDFSY